MEDFRDEGQILIQSLIEQLHSIETREQLLSASPKLKRLFNDLVDLMITAQQYKEKHPEREVLEISKEQHTRNSELRKELDRLYGKDGFRPILERCQEEALHRLDAFEKRLKSKTL